MIDLYYWPTSNGHKITIFLEEAGQPYTIHPINISKGDQFRRDFLAISPNNRMPAIVDHAPKDGGEPIGIFESGAILLYLAEKTGRFMPRDLRGRHDASQWLFWQVGGLGPMAGQRNHFLTHTSEPIAYPIDRYTNEVDRLWGVIDRRLADRPFLAGDYSIADMATYPWINSSRRHGDMTEKFPNVKRWWDAIAARPAVVAAYAKGEPYENLRASEEESRKIMFGQTAATTAAAAR